MKLVIHSLFTGEIKNLRTWQPEDPASVVLYVAMDIGERGKKTSDVFSIRVATPAGLAKLDAKDGILAMRPLLVLDQYDFTALWHWLEKTVKTCEQETWQGCVDHLRRYFSWEYDGYKET